jgi:hypothetical protein
MEVAQKALPEKDTPAPRRSIVEPSCGLRLHRADTHAPDVASDFDHGHGGGRGAKGAKVVGNDGAGECSTV